MPSALFALFSGDKNNTALSLGFQTGGEAFLRAARDDRSERKNPKKEQHLRTGASSAILETLCEDGDAHRQKLAEERWIYSMYVSDRVTCLFLVFSRNKERQGERGSCFLFFVSILIKNRSLFPQQSVSGRDVQDGSSRALSSFHQQPRAGVFNAS